MGQVLHGCAKTTEAVRINIKNSQESLKKLAQKYAINPKTVAKWKKRETAKDIPMGPKNPHSTTLTLEEEAACIAFRKHTLLSLDDCLYALQNSIPKLTRSSLHRLFKRHGISRLPEGDGDKQVKKKFKAYPIGYVHIDTAEVSTEEGRLYLFVAIDRTSKFVYVELLEKYGKAQAAQFLRNFIQKMPYKIHTILTDNGIQFTHRKDDKHAWMHVFERICRDNQIEHRL
ncbi:MAG: DDE-type integrase/transposase/recombinase, partial [Cetobacterium sp.]